MERCLTGLGSTVVVDPARERGSPGFPCFPLAYALGFHQALAKIVNH